MHAVNDIGILSRPAGYGQRMGSPVRASDLVKWAVQMLSSRSHLVALVRHVQVLRSGEVRSFDHVQAKNSPTRPKAPLKPFEQRLRAFVHLCRDFGIEPVLMTQPLSSSRSALTPDWTDLGNQDRFNMIVREVAASEGALLIDLVEHLREDVRGWDEPMKIFYDGLHVTDEGSDVYATHIASRLLPSAIEIAANKRR